MKRTALALATLVMLTPLAAPADNLYEAAPPPAGPGHPLRLGPDHRAQQVGDLVYIVFDFNDANSHTNNYSSQKQFALSGGNGTGVFNLPLVRLSSSVNGSSSTQTQQAANGQDSFTSTMMATVTDVLPSGALEIQGDQGVVINGREQTLHITGYVRPQDIDFTDAVLSSRVANVKATFKGDDQRHKSWIQQILSWLF